MADQKRILIIDDDREAVAQMSTLLGSAGYAVETAHDGLAGLARARDLSPDMIVVDAVLPKLNGFKVARFLKFDETYKHIPILIVSARAEATDRELGMEVGASAYLTKPPKEQELLETIRIQLGLSNLD